MKDKKLVELWGHIHWLGVLEEQGLSLIHI